MYLLTYNTKTQINFYTDSTCTGCGTCEKVCLSKKIKMYNRRSAWQKNVNCYYCYACFNYRHRVSGPAYILTWNWQIAKESVAILAALEPRVLACGHGIAMIGSGTAHELRAFSDRFS